MEIHTYPFHRKFNGRVSQSRWLVRTEWWVTPDHCWPVWAWNPVCTSLLCLSRQVPQFCGQNVEQDIYNISRSRIKVMTSLACISLQGTGIRSIYQISCLFTLQGIKICMWKWTIDFNWWRKVPLLKTQHARPNSFSISEAVSLLVVLTSNTLLVLTSRYLRTSHFLLKISCTDPRVVTLSQPTLCHQIPLSHHIQRWRHLAPRNGHRSTATQSVDRTGHFFTPF